MIRCDGRVAVVTGAGRGLGAAYARALAERGASVVVHDAGVGRGGEGGDPSIADAVAESIRASGGTAVASYGIRANAISPVAATRIYTQEVKPGELEPEQVAPGVVFLASEDCGANGAVLGAAGGMFAGRRWARSEGVHFGPEPPTPEAIAERWSEISR